MFDFQSNIFESYDRSGKPEGPVRHEIGPKTKIDKGQFTRRRQNLVHEVTVVDYEKYKNIFPEQVNLLNTVILPCDEGKLLPIVAASVNKYMPLNIKAAEDIFIKSHRNRSPKVSLESFMVDKDSGANGGGGPDQRALFAARLVEQWINSPKGKNSGAKVSIETHPGDGHAIVKVETKNGKMLTFHSEKPNGKFETIVPSR